MKTELEILSKLKEYFKKCDEVSFVYLYGSFGTEYQTDFSDVDIAIYQIHEKSKYEYRNLEFKIEVGLSQLFPNLNFDVRSLNDAPIMIVGKIIDEGKLIFASNEIKHFEYVELHRLMYMDYQIIYKPLFEYYYKELLND